VLVLCLSGRIAAGKSTLSRQLHERLGWPTASFGEYVRSEASRRGLGSQRETLQNLGAELIEAHGWQEFCRRTLAHASVSTDDAPVLVEGVRHAPALAALRILYAPTPVRLVHVLSSEEQRQARLRDRGVSRLRADAWTAHSTEHDVAVRLPELADLAVSADDSAVDVVLAWLGRIGVDVRN
jgi:dephospho-CoA kinase